MNNRDDRIEELLSFLSHIGFTLEEWEEQRIRDILTPPPTLSKVQLQYTPCQCIHCMRLD